MMNVTYLSCSQCSERYERGALAAYAAKAGLEAYIFMPRDVPQANLIECQQCGAKVTLVDGLITDCGRIVAERKEAEGWFEVSTLKEGTGQRPVPPK